MSTSDHLERLAPHLAMLSKQSLRLEELAKEIKDNNLQLAVNNVLCWLGVARHHIVERPAPDSPAAAVLDGKPAWCPHCGAYSDGESHALRPEHSIDKLCAECQAREDEIEAEFDRERAKRYRVTLRAQLLEPEFTWDESGFDLYPDSDWPEGGSTVDDVLKVMREARDLYGEWELQPPPGHLKVEVVSVERIEDKP